MANTIRVKRRSSGAIGAPASLENAELAFNEVDDVLYYGKGTGGAGGTATTIEAIAGKGAYLALSGDQTVAGVKTFSSTIVGSISGNAGTVTDGVYTTGSYANPTWITSLAGSKVSGNITGNAANVTGTVAIANGGSGATTAAAARTAFGATTVGGNFFTLANPSAVTFVRVNADNTVSTLDAATFRTAIGAGTGSGTVTSVAALTLGTTGTDLTSSVANGTTTPVITLNVPTASATNRGVLSSADWTTFNNKGSGSVTSVALALPSFITVSGSPVTGTGTLTGTLASQTANTVFAAPNGSAGAPTFRVLAAADIPTLTAAKISDFDTQVRTSRLDQMAAPTAAVALNSQKITGLATPTADTDAATKGYVDSVAQGLDPKQSVGAASTANIATLSGLLTIDGVTLTAGERVLVKNQTTTSQNGIYVASATAWSRALDMDAWTEVPNAFVFVEEGSTQADTGWVCTANTGGTLNTTPITWAQFSGAGTYIAGNGLTLTGSTFDVVGTTNRITVTADSVDIASTYVGQATITTLGTVATGTWNATTIGTTKGGTGLTSFTSGGALYATSTSALTTGTLPVASGGTGATTLTGYVKGTGTAALTASATIPNTDITGLGTMSTQAASNVAITGGTIDGVTIDGGTF